MKPAVIFLLVSVVALAPVFGEDVSIAPAPSEVTSLVNDGAAAFRAGKLKDAFKKFKLADERSQGRSWDAVAGAASASLHMGKFARGHDYAERLLEMDHSSDRKGIALYLQGVSLAGLNMLPQAEAALRESLALRPGRPVQARTSLVAVLCRRNMHEEGLSLLDEGGVCAEASAGLDEGEWESPTRFEKYDDCTEPIKLSGATPEYPEQDRLAWIEGKVVLDTLIGSDGSIHCVKVLKGPTPDMNCSAAVAVMGWKFQPSTLDGEPVEVFYNLAVHFDLR